MRMFCMQTHGEKPHCSYVPRSCGLLLTRGANDKQGAAMAKASTAVVARIVGAV
jgi:hypothetical protein